MVLIVGLLFTSMAQAQYMCFNPEVSPLVLEREGPAAFRQLTDILTEKCDVEKPHTVSHNSAIMGVLATNFIIVCCHEKPEQKN